MKTLFLIERTPFLRNMIELVLREEGLKVYSLESDDDCFYQMVDLSPALLMLDLGALSDHFFVELAKYPELTKIPILGLLKKGETHPFMDQCQALLEGPLSPPQLSHKVNEILALKS